MRISKYIDYIDDPEDTFLQYINKGKFYDFRCVFADLETYAVAVEYLKDTSVIIAGAIDFPEGKLSLDEKMKMFKTYAEKGFREIDYVLNQKAVEQKDYLYIEKEMSCIADFCRTHGILDKAIVEMCKLDNDEAAKREICRIANKTKPAFLKTSTGKSYAGAKLEDVKLMKSILHDDIKIKAAGGIHNYQEAMAFIKAGASVLGASAGIAIVKGETQNVIE